MHIQHHRPRPVVSTPLPIISFDEGNQFKRLDNMHNHMTRKIDEHKKNLEIANNDDSSSDSESLKEATKTPMRKRKHDSDKSDEEDS
jgi:hypothetical protein